MASTDQKEEVESNPEQSDLPYIDTTGPEQHGEKLDSSNDGHRQQKQEQQQKQQKQQKQQQQHGGKFDFSSDGHRQKQQEQQKQQQQQQHQHGGSFDLSNDGHRQQQQEQQKQQRQQHEQHLQQQLQQQQQHQQQLQKQQQQQQPVHLVPEVVVVSEDTSRAELVSDNDVMSLQSEAVISAKDGSDGDRSAAEHDALLSGSKQQGSTGENDPLLFEPKPHKSTEETSEHQQSTMQSSEDPETLPTSSESELPQFVAGPSPERDARWRRCCQSCCNAILLDDVTEPCCCCLRPRDIARQRVTGVTSGNGENVGRMTDSFSRPTPCWCLKKRRKTDIELRLERIEKTMLGSGQETAKDEGHDDNTGEGEGEKTKTKEKTGLAQSAEEKTGLTQSAEEKRKLKGRLIRLEDDASGRPRWRLEGGRGWVHDYNKGRWRELDSEKLTATLDKDESDWTSVERQDLLAWLGYKEDDVTNDAESSSLCLDCVKSAFHDDVTSLCCCCLTWGIFYKDSQLEFQVVSFQWFDVCLAVFSICLYVVDFATDLWLAYTYLQAGHKMYFAITLVFVCLAYVCNAVMTVQWSRGKIKPDFRGKQWIPVLLGILFNLGPCITSAIYVYYLCRSRQAGLTHDDRQRYVRTTKNRSEDSCRLLLAEGCLESAPQLTFQIYVLLVTRPTLTDVAGVWRVLTLLTSWLSLALTVSAYNKTSRLNRRWQEHPATSRHMSAEMLFRLAETGGRVLCIALFTSVFRWWVLAVLLPHGLLMAAWYFKKDQHRPTLSQAVANLLLAYVSVFAFIPRCRPLVHISMDYSRVRYLVFYVLFYCENFTMLFLWYSHVPGSSSEGGRLFRTWGLVAGLAALPLHVGLLLFYYGCCHPRSEYVRNKEPRLPVEWREWKQELLDTDRPARV